MRIAAEQLISTRRQKKQNMAWSKALQHSGMVLKQVNILHKQYKLQYKRKARYLN